MSSECNFGNISGVCAAAFWFESVAYYTVRVIFILEKGEDVIIACGPFSVFGADMGRDSDGTNTSVEMCVSTEREGSGV